MSRAGERPESTSMSDRRWTLAHLFLKIAAVAILVLGFGYTAFFGYITWMVVSDAANAFLGTMGVTRLYLFGGSLTAGFLGLRAGRLGLRRVRLELKAYDDLLSKMAVGTYMVLPWLTAVALLASPVVLLWPAALGAYGIAVRRRSKTLAAADERDVVELRRSITGS